MPAWTVASLSFFVYVAAVALLTPALDRRSRGRALAGCVLGAALALLGALALPFWLRMVVLPPLVLLVAYWSSGLLWVGPMERVEKFFVASDRSAGVPQIAAATPRLVVELLELAYAFVYPLIPIAMGLHMAYAPAPDADRFWTVILVTDYVCFGMLPWIQTRPPRLLDPLPPWRSRMRAFNVRLLGETSIGVNTVPSGHAAEAAAAALLLTGAAWPLVALMWIVAVAISAGAVLGRYHFAVDALAGWAVAALVWVALA